MFQQKYRVQNKAGNSLSSVLVGLTLEHNARFVDAYAKREIDQSVFRSNWGIVRKAEILSWLKDMDVCLERTLYNIWASGKSD